MLLAILSVYIVIYVKHSIWLSKKARYKNIFI